MSNTTQTPDMIDTTAPGESLDSVIQRHRRELDEAIRQAERQARDAGRDAQAEAVATEGEKAMAIIIPRQTATGHQERKAWAILDVSDGVWG